MTNELSPDKKSSLGCGLFNAVFGRKKFEPRRSASTGSIPTQTNGNVDIIFTSTRKMSSAGHNSKRRRGGLEDLNNGIPPLSPQPSPNHGAPQATSSSSSPSPQPNIASARQKQCYHTSHNKGRNNYEPSNYNETSLVPVPRNAGVVAAPQQSQRNTKTVPKDVPLGISDELESLIAEHQRNRGGAQLVRVSSGNVMVHRNLGNLRQAGGTTYTYPKPTPRDDHLNQSPNNNAPRYLTSGMGNIVNKKHQQLLQKGGKSPEGPSLCRALSCRMDPEELKILGNEDYKNGRFAEALALYERAVDLDPSKAAYRSNKSAALAALGRLLEAVFECREAIRIEPRYQRAHHRLANLYLRLGEAEKAVYHFRQAGPEADPDEMSKAKTVLAHLRKCDEAKRCKDWNTLLKESSNAAAAGADSAPLIFALQAESYLKLRKYQEADKSLGNSPNFSLDQCTKFFGPIANASMLVIKAQVDMAVGRFDEALEAAERAGRLDPSNREVGFVTKRAQAVSAARTYGNDLFKDSEFSEACIAYGEGLELDPCNSVLLCNRAACCIKLGKFEKAIEDCSAALNVRPLYTKARLRRAECNAKLQKWELAIRDYELLLQESPGDEGVCKALFEALLQLKKQRGEDISHMKFENGGVIKIQSNEHFRNLTSWPGLLVAWFYNTPRDKQTLQFLEDLCKKYPTVKFIKVEVEDNEWLVKSEGVSSLPGFRVYKSGSRVKEVPGEDHEALESSIKEFIR